MGYTRYWDRTTKPIDQDFIDAITRVIADSEKRGIEIRGGDGSGSPHLGLDFIAFNGNGDLRLDHETCYFGKETGFEFCKTARKPYDYTVRQALKIAEQMGMVTDVSSDGPNDEIISDEDYLNRNKR